MTNNKKQTILIVEDEPALLKAYIEQFTEEGFIVLEAHNGQEGYDKALSGKPDIILLDILMPVMDGFAMYETIKKENLAPGALTIMLTNQGTVSDINRAKELGINGFIVKATTIPSEVVEEVKMLLNKNKK